jgi:hypothetical protein
VLPHVPQLVGLLEASVSQPVAGLPEQFMKPGLQAMRQVPAAHIAWPLVEGQILPQAPQLLMSVERSRQFPEQDVWLAGQVGGEVGEVAVAVSRE